MTKTELHSQLSYVNHSRENRLKYAHMVLDNLKLLPIVMDLCFDVEDKISFRAAWLLEFVVREQLDAILPYLDRFTEQIPTVKRDEAIRPMAKICEYLIMAYYHKNNNATKKYLTKRHRERITELCFDYMITNQKIAPKAYSMNSLFLLGREFDWIHPELEIILERDLHMQSSGFKARAKYILKKIKK